MKHFIYLVFKNKILWYVLTRYFTYGIQFFVSIYCAAKMGPYYFGLWGFILLIYNYMQQINLGIPNSTNILLTQEAKNFTKFAKIESNAFYSMFILVCGVIIFALGNYFYEYSFLNKYPIGNLFYIICFTAIIAYFVQICTSVYRIKHRLPEIALSQSIIPVMTLFPLFLAVGKELLIWFVYIYLLGNCFSLVVYFSRGYISVREKFSLDVVKSVMGKGLYLFIYNCCFYFIIISTRTVISYFYPVEEFGFFTFAYTLADSVLLLLSSITFLLFPKSIEKLYSTNRNQILSTISLLRVNYITMTHGLMYLAFMFFPLITHFMPQYNEALPAIYMVSIALICYAMSCAYPDYLMAQNHDHILAVISFISLLLNVVLSIIVASVFHSSYYYVVSATIFSYVIFSFLSFLCGSYFINRSWHGVIKSININFPFCILLPFFLACIVVSLEKVILLPIPFLCFLLLNLKSLKEIYVSINKIIRNPDILDVSIS